MCDIVKKIGKGSLIQHGEHNDRIYLMKFDIRDSDTILQNLSELASKYNYSKIFCKVPKNMAPIFIADGYVLEAFIPRFYNKQKDVFFVSKFLNPERQKNIEKEQLSVFSNNILETPGEEKDLNNIIKEYSIRKLDKPDVSQITNIYKEVFKTYPFPIHKPEYILETMDEGVQYYGAEKDGKLAALSASEIDFEGKNAEMTDFATLHNHGGKNLASLLLKKMEKEMKNQGITTLYTIARLNSIPMNITFLRNDYNYSGTLLKNTNISGKIESMNIYHKEL